MKIRVAVESSALEAQPYNAEVTYGSPAEAQAAIKWFMRFGQLPQPVADTAK